jgi:hypothetical protein
MITNSIFWALAWLFLQAFGFTPQGWRMEGFNPSRTNVSTVAGPNSRPEFDLIASNVSGTLKRIADDGSLILTDGATVSSYRKDGQLQWRTNILLTLSGPVVDIAVSSSGVVYVSSANHLIALDPKSGQPAWPQTVATNSGDESGPLVVGSDGTIYFHTGSTQPGYQERLTAINPDGTLKWDYAGNTGHGSGRPVFNSDESTIYLQQLRFENTGGGKVVGLAAATGQSVFETPCDVRGGVYAYSRAKVLYTGDINNNLLQFPTDSQNCAVSTSGLAVADTAAVLSTLFVVQIPLPGTGTSYAAVNAQGRRIWSRIDPLIRGFADNGGEGSGTFFAIAPQTNEIVAIRIATGEELWRQQFSAPVSTLLLGGNGSLYAVVGNDLFSTAGAHFGHSHTTSTVPPPVSRRPKASVSANDGAVVSALTTDPSIVGQWSAPAAWPVVAVHLSLLRTGKVLAFDNALDNTTSAVVWDPATNTFTNVSPADNLFCSGETQLADGRIMVIGGHINDDIGIKDVNIFDPVTQTWSLKAPMSYARWYPTVITLSDGRVLALEGTQNCKDCIASTPEIYNPATDTWQQLTSATSAFARYFPHAFALPNGKVLVTGSSQVANATDFAIPSRTLDVNTQTWTLVDPNTTADGLSAMYLPGKLVRIGGTWDDGDGSPSNATSVLDMTAATPAWRSTAPMSISRVLHNLTILPDGTVLTTGGSTNAVVNPPASAYIYTAELWNPNTETWTTLSNMQTPRLYHSTTALLPDGRVLVAGGGRAFTADQLSAEIFSPPYLFKGTRPTITSAPSVANYNSSIFVGTPNATSIAKVSLVRLTSVTHTTNFNQRFVPLTFTQATGGLNVTTPANVNVAPPGYYMLFILDANGVPSVAPFLQLTTGSTAPSAPTNLTATAASTSQINLTWTASTGNVTSYLIERCAGAGCTNFSQTGTSGSASYSDSLLMAGTSYSYRVRATDGTNFSGYSNVASATTPVSGTPPTPPSNLTATPATSTQINLSWTASTSSIGVANYLVERCQGTGCSTFSQIATPTGTSYADSGLIAATSYSYRVRATDTVGNISGYSNVASATTGVNNGLVAAYSFSEGTGTTVADESGNGNTGTLSSVAWTTSGKYSNALVFNGTSSIVTVNDSPLLQLTTAMTLEAWVYPTKVPSGWVDVIYKQDDNYMLSASSNGGPPGPTGAGTFGGTFQQVAGPSALGVNTWTHVAVTFDGANLTVWVNGVSVASQAATPPLLTSNLPLQIGGDSIFGQYFTGRIDEVRIYNRALSKNEIEVDMNSPIHDLHDITPPTAPTNLTASASGSQVALTWTPSTDNIGVTGYLIERCTGAGCSNFTQIASTAGFTTTSYTDTGLVSGTTYVYRVAAKDAAGNLSGYSNTASTSNTSNAPPTVATPASASPNPVTGTTTNLSVLGADDGGEANLTYTWATTGTPPAPVTFSANGTNAAKNVVATFTKAGSYSFQVTIKDQGNLTVTSSVGVTVNQILTSISVAPSSATVAVSATQQFTATGLDQFGVAMTAQPAFSWTVSGGGTINTAGLFTAGSTAGGPFTVTASSGSVNGTASVTVGTANAPPTVVTPASASPNPVTASTTNLSVLGADDGGEANLTYTWATTGTPPAPVTFSANGTNAAKNVVATFTKSGSYSFQVTIKDQGNLTVTSSVNVTVNQTLTSISVAPSSASVTVSATQQFTATGLDQFGVALTAQPAFSWTVSGGGTISAAGLFTAGGTAGGPFTVTASSGAIKGTASVTVTAAAFVAYVQGAATTNNAAGTSMSQAFTTANVAGNLIVAAVSWSNGSVTCSDSQGNSYSVATTQYDNVNDQSLAICYAANVKAGANTVTATFSGSATYRRLLIHEYQGVALVNPVDVVAKNNAAGSTAANAITSTAAVTTASGDLIFGAVMDDSGIISSITAGTSFTQRLSVNNKDMATEDLVQAAAGSIAATQTFGSADRYLAQMVAFKASGSGSSNAPPTVATPASASPNPVTASTTNLSVLGADDGGEANLTYTWATTGTPPAAVTFSANGTNAAKNAVATFTKAGSYSLQVTIRDQGNLAVTSSVSVTVNQTFTSISVAPSSATVALSGTRQFTATALDQFGGALTAQPAFSWTVSGGGTISATGLFTAGSTAGGPFTVTASSGGINGTASVTVAVTAVPQFVQGAATTNDAGSTSITQAFTTANVAGNLIVAAVSWSNGSVTCSDSQGNSYSVATTQYDNVNDQSLAICYAANVKGGANTVTATFSGSATYRRLLIHEYSGVALVNPLDVVAKNNANGTTAANAITSTAAVTTASGDLIFGAVMDDSGIISSITAGTGFTQRLSVNNKDMATEDLVQAAAGSIAATDTFGAAHRYLAQMVAFKHQ